MKRARKDRREGWNEGKEDRRRGKAVGRRLKGKKGRRKDEENRKCINEESEKGWKGRME